MAGRLHSKLLGVVLVFALVASAGFITTSLGTLASSVPSVRLVKPTSERVEQSYGTLYMDVLLGIRQTFYGALSLPTYFKPIAGESVSISLSNAPEATPLILSTNSSGLLKVRLPVSDHYLVTINDLRFYAAIPFRIVPNETTFLLVKAVRQSFPVVFSEFYPVSFVENISGGQTVYLRVRSPTTPPEAGSSIFLEVGDSSVKGFVDPSVNATVRQIPLKLVEVAGQRETWMHFQATERVEVEKAAKLFLVTYTPVYTESIGNE